MAEKQMNMHRLLSELKMLDKRIAKCIPVNNRIMFSDNENLQLIGASREVDQKIGTQTREEFTATLEGNWQMIQALIRNKKSLEAVKVKSNAETKVSIAGSEYTVADAIKRKLDIAYDKALLQSFESQHRNVVNLVAEQNETAERQADKHVEALFNGQNSKSENIGKEAEKQRENYMKNHRWSVIDPNGSDKLIQSLHEDIDSFEAEVDAVLSESNAITMVDVILVD